MHYVFRAEVTRAHFAVRNFLRAQLTVRNFHRAQLSVRNLPCATFGVRIFRRPILCENGKYQISFSSRFSTTLDVNNSLGIFYSKVKRFAKQNKIVTESRVTWTDRVCTTTFRCFGFRTSRIRTFQKTKNGHFFKGIL